MSKVVRVAVTGAAGRVSSSLIVRLASGEVFGPDTKVILQLLELPVAMKNLEGAMYELQDCGFSTLQGCHHHRRREQGVRGVQLGPAGRRRPAGRASSAATSSARTGRSSSARGRPSPRTPPRTCAFWSSATRATRTASSPSATARTSPPIAGTP